MAEEKKKELTGYPSIDMPWMKYYPGDKGVKAPSTECGIDCFLRECSKDRMSSTALDYYGNKITYREMFDNVDIVASALQSAGVCPGDMVSVCCLNTPEFVYLLYAINKVGAISNWVAPTSTVEDLREQIQSTHSRILFVVDIATEKLLDAVRGTEVRKVITVPISWSMPGLLRLILQLKSKNKNTSAEQWHTFLEGSTQVSMKEAHVRGQNTAIIEYTGGSTGIPKGVMLSNANLNSYLINFRGANRAGLSDYRPGNGFLAAVPFFLAFGASSGCHGPLCHGMHLVLAPDPTPDTLGKLILQRKPNYIVAGRAQIDGFVKRVKSSKKDLSFLHSVMYGGEPIDKKWAEETERLFHEHNSQSAVLNGYGMSETAAAILIESDKISDGLLPIANVTAKVIDPETGTELTYDIQGELCLSSLTVMKGYLGNTYATDNAVFEEDGRRWLRTGDLAKISQDGTIHITGRIKRIYHKITSDGIDARVYPARIEETIMSSMAVERCAVIGVKDAETAYRTIAYIRLKDSIPESDEIKSQIDSCCHAQLPDSHLPDEYRFCKEFPLTRAGKIDYVALENSI